MQQNSTVGTDGAGAPMNPMIPLANNPMNPLPQVAEGTQQFCLRWNSYPATVATQLAALRQAEDFVDVTLACDGRQLRAHKLVLSACSPYFMQLFKSTPCQHPVIFLQDVRFRQLVALLEFMYAGEVNVSQLELPALLRTAEALQVRGLADTTANNNTASQPPPPQRQCTQGFSPQYAPAPAPAQPMMPPQQQQTLAPVPCEPPAEATIPNPPPTPPLSSTPKRIPKEEEEEVLPEELNTNIEEDESSSESNDSQDDFEVTESDMKEFINHTPSTDQIQDPVDLFGVVDDETGIPMDLNPTEVGTASIAGSQSEEETSDEDDDDGECKEFTYQSDASYSQETMPEAGSTENGENVAGPSGISSSVPPVAGSAAAGCKEEGAVPVPSGGGSGSSRSRLSRSLWPPGIPYHGPQQCPYCPRVLSNVGNWRKHVLTMHFAREKVYKCRHCNSAFRTAEYLQKHYVRVHNYPQKMTRRKYVENT